MWTRRTLKATSPAAATDLTTPARAIQRLGLPGLPTDPALEARIAAASALIVAYLREPQAAGDVATIGRQSLRETFVRRATDDAAGTDGVSLSRLPVVRIDAVTEGPATVASMVDAAPNPLFLYEYDAISGRMYKVDADGAPAPFDASLLVIDYTAGWRVPAETGADLPAAIESAAITAVGALRQQDAAMGGQTGVGSILPVKAETIPGVGSWQWAVNESTFGDAGLPVEVERALRLFRRPVL